MSSLSPWMTLTRFSDFNREFMLHSVVWAPEQIVLWKVCQAALCVCCMKSWKINWGILQHGKMIVSRKAKVGERQNACSPYLSISEYRKNGTRDIVRFFEEVRVFMNIIYILQLYQASSFPSNYNQIIWQEHTWTSIHFIINTVLPFYNMQFKK